MESRAGPAAATVRGVIDTAHTALGSVRYELLPFDGAVRAAALVERPLTLTVTCSPRHGIDATVDVACRLRALGHTVVPHMAARMVRDTGHLDELLDRLASAGIDDVFLVGGDAAEPHGDYGSALDLIAALREHTRAPRRIGVAAYPEGHPLIDASGLHAALLQKAGYADYMVSQLCFDMSVLRRWLAATRAAGVELPLLVGAPGIVDRRRLLEVSMRIGVGASVRFVRKQRGLRRLLGLDGDAAERLATAVVPLIGTELGVAGVHFFTFNRLVETVRFVDRRSAEPSPIGASRRT